MVVAGRLCSFLSRVVAVNGFAEQRLRRGGGSSAARALQEHRVINRCLHFGLLAAMRRCRRTVPPYVISNVGFRFRGND